MKKIKDLLTPEFTFKVKKVHKFSDKVQKKMVLIIFVILSIISVISFIHFYLNGYSVAYNDARSHLDIGRRVVENLKPGLAQLGSVWLPLPHLLMVPTIWNDFMWHSGLSGAIQSMVSYVMTGIVIYYFLKRIGVGMIGRLTAIIVFALNTNIIYLQATAMTELLLLATMTIGVYEIVMWHKTDNLLNFVKAAFWILLSTLIRYDGWFLFGMSTGMITLFSLKKFGFSVTKGKVILFITLASFGIFLWLLWNLLIFGDPLYFALGPYSARAQQTQLEHAGVLPTKGDLLLSLKIYFYAVVYNSNAFIVFLSILGAAMFWLDKKIDGAVRYASLTLLAPFLFNILALYLGHSVLYVQGVTGNSWFNVRYGLMMVPSLAIFTGYLVHKLPVYKYAILGLILFLTLFSYLNFDAVTLDDALVGSSGKNVSEVSGWLRRNAKDKEGFILISAASHDAIIFSSGLPMSRFIHEGTGLYWDSAVSRPDKWARWIIMRTNDENDSTFKSIKTTRFEAKYTLIESFPFADIYELRSEYLDTLETNKVFNNQK